MKVLITAPYSDKYQQVLKEKLGEVIYKPWKDQGNPNTEEDLFELLGETDADALITEHDRVSEKVIRTYPDLKFIGVCRGTPSNVSLDTAEQHKIPVFTAPGRNAQAVAELFVANVISFLRNTVASWKWIQNGEWKEGNHRSTSYLYFKGNELAGKTVGMVGFGAVGQRIADIIIGFPCRIQFYDPYIASTDSSYEKTSLEELFETSDVVSVNLPVNKETTGMINRPLLSRMKPDAVFVNTARAAVVNTEALFKVLKQKHIRGAVLDVFDGEPPTPLDNKIIQLPNVLATPHIAGATEEVENHHSRIMNQAILDWWQEQSKLQLND